MILTEAQHKAFGSIRSKSYEAKVEVKSLNDADYTVEVVVTTVSIDREGEVVLPSAVAKRLAIYFLNPILLWGHKRMEGPEYALGVCLSLTPLADGSGWVAKFRYDVEINEMAKQVWLQIKAGTQRSWSISFLPWAWVTRYSSAEEINALPEPVRSWLLAGLCKVVYTDVEILEISNVHIASNRDSILRSLEKIAMEVNADKPGQPVSSDTVTKAVANTPAEPVRKYHPKVNDIGTRLRNLSYSLEGPGWDEYDGEKLPPPERVSACLEILGEIQTSMQSLLVTSHSTPAAPVTLAVSAPATEKAAPELESVASPEPSAPLEKAVAAVETAQDVASEPELVAAEFDPIAAAERYLQSILD